MIIINNYKKLTAWFLNGDLAYCILIKMHKIWPIKFIVLLMNFSMFDFKHFLYFSMTNYFVLVSL